MLIKVGKVRAVRRVQRYPECTNTRELEKSEPESESGEEEIEPCENCGEPMVVKRGRFGQFLACTGYPECKTTRKLIATKQGGLKAAKPDQILDEKCPRCESNLVRQAGPLRRVHGLHQLSGVPVHQAQDDRRQVSEGCRQGRRNRRAQVETRQSSSSGARTTRTAISCCGIVRLPKTCSKCGAPYLVEKITKKHGRQILCNNEECDYARSEELPVTAA